MIIDNILWKPIKGYEKEYMVSRDGRVFSVRSNKDLLPSVSEKGYLRVCLQLNGIKCWKRVHRLVAETFIPNPLKKETVNHKNGIRNDNRVENLEWATMYEQNSLDERHKKNISVNIGKSKYITDSKRKVIQKGLNGDIIKVHESMNNAAREMESSVGNIYLCCNGKRKTCKGYYFEYAK